MTSFGNWLQYKLVYYLTLLTMKKSLFLLGSIGLVAVAIALSLCVGKTYAGTSDAYLIVVSNPHSAEVLVDNSLKGTTDVQTGELKVSGLTLGSHTIEVEKDKYWPSTQTINISSPGNAGGYIFVLDPQTGTYTVTASPTSAKVFMDNSLKGTTDAITGKLAVPGLILGNHKLEIQKDGYWPLIVTVNVYDSGGTGMYYVLKPLTGSLTVTSNVMGADIFIDGFHSGKKTGVKQQVVVSGLTIGNHTLKITKNGYQTYTKTFKIYDTGGIGMYVKLKPVTY